MKRLFLLGFVCLILNACTKDDHTDISFSKPETISENTYREIVCKLTEDDQVLMAIGKAIASSAEEPSVRSFLKNEMLKKVDGDYDVFYPRIKNDLIDDESLFNKIQNHFSFINQNISAYKKKMALNQLIETSNPLLNVLIPSEQQVNAEVWDTTKDDLLVAVVTSETNESDYLFAYDSQGNTYKIDAQIPPSQPTIVLGTSERVVLMRQNEIEDCLSEIPPFYVDGDNYYFEKKALNNCQSFFLDDTPPADIFEKSTCFRDTYIGDGDYMTKVRFENMTALRDAESWWGGDIELTYTILLAESKSIKSLTKRMVNEREEYEEGNWFTGKNVRWKSLNHYLFTWPKLQYGQTMNVIWYEEDGSKYEAQEMNLTTNVVTGVDAEGKTTKTETVTGSISIKLVKRRDELGESFMQYCDKVKEGKEYSTGYLRFVVQRK